MTDLRCGDWILGQVLGEGLQGKVYRATHCRTGETCAIKFVFKDGMNDKDIKHLKNEIKALSMLKSKTRHVVEILEFEESARLGTKDAFAIRTQLCNGGELFTYLMYTGRFEEKLARTFFLQLLSCVEKMHENKFVHRDIKAENILLHEGILKLGDFGFARRYCDCDDLTLPSLKRMQTQCGTCRYHLRTRKNTQNIIIIIIIAGTPGYTAPEILATIRFNESYTGTACDIWSAGILLFIMLVGVPPMGNACSGDWWFDRISERRYDRFWASHEQTGHVISDSAKDLIIKMLSPDPNDRISLPQIFEHKFLNMPCLTMSDAAKMLRQKKVMCDRAVETERLEEEAKSRDFDPFASKPVYRCTTSNVDVDRPPDLKIRNLTCVPLRTRTTWTELERTLFSGFISQKMDAFTRVYECKRFKMRVSLRHDKGSDVLQLQRLSGDLLEFSRVFCQVSTEFGHRIAMVPRSKPIKIKL